MMNIQYPNITGRTPEEQIGQIVSYLRQLADQLNYEGIPSNVEPARDASIQADQLRMDGK